MEDYGRLRRELDGALRQLKCLMSMLPAATIWTPDHTIANGYKYTKGTLVWYEGHIYKAKADNSGSAITNTFFWENLGCGWKLAQEQADWLATEGPSFIRNKPPGMGGEELDPKFQEWLDSNPLAGFLTEEIDPKFQEWLDTNPLADFITNEVDPVFNAWLLTNPLAGFLTSEVDPVFNAWLLTNPLSAYLLSATADTLYYPLSANPAGYLTQEEVLEFDDEADFPPIGDGSVIYVATHVSTTGIPEYYIWDGDSYETSTVPITGITGSGTTDFIPKFTSATSIGNSIIKELLGTIYVGGTMSPTLGNTILSIQRVSGQSQIDFSLGHPLIPQESVIQSNNTHGLHITSRGYLSLRAGMTYTEALRILGTGQINITQVPTTGTKNDKILLRDVTTGDLKQIDYPIVVKSFGVNFDGNGSAITTGSFADITIPFGMTITSWTLLGDVSGDIVIDVYVDTYANFPPTGADSITASAKPTITSDVKGQSSTLTGWTTTITAGRTIRFHVDSCTNITKANLLIQGTLT